MERTVDRVARAVTWAAIGCLIAALPRASSAQQGSAVTEGARVYGSMCGRCHNPRSPLERTDRDWVTIANHMRVRANLTGKQVRSVLAFLQATNTDPRERVQLPEAATPPPRTTEIRPGQVQDTVATDRAVIARGKTLVEQRACLGCHVIGSAGGKVGPSLNGVVGRRGAGFVRRKLADPTFNNATSMMPNFGLPQDEIEAIVAYLYSLEGR